MQLVVTIALAILLFIAFTIGLNLGLHGVLSLREYHNHNDVAILESPVIHDNRFLNPDEVVQPPIFRSTVPSSHSQFETKILSERSLGSPSPEKNFSEKELFSAAAIVDALILQSSIAGAASDSARVQSLRNKYTHSKPRDGAISKYIDSGFKIPILLLTCNRPDLLQQTIHSLLMVRGIDKSKIVVSQDGTEPEVTSVIRENNLHLIHDVMRDGGNFYGGQKIAMHYGFSISKAFEHFGTAPAIIIIEDDLLFSPDFYEYMHAVAPILETDPSTFVLSAWNDNGFKGKVHDKLALRRTEFFPGLGWLLPRALYKGELEQRWPTEHWDHWLRSTPVHKGREIIYPQIPRTFHNGIKGTFMDLSTHNKYFRDIDYNTDSAPTWLTSSSGRSLDTTNSEIEAYVDVVGDVYEARIEELISTCFHVRSIQDLVTQRGLLCVWLSVRPEPRYQGVPPEFEPVASFFGIWHEHKRGGHRGLHEFYWGQDGESYVLLLNIHEDIQRAKKEFGVLDNSYAAQKPRNAVIIAADLFDKKALVEARRKAMGLEGYSAGTAGLSCDQVCAELGKECKPELMTLLNTCPALNDKFPCRECISSMGMEQPAYVALDARPEFGPGKCLVTTQLEPAKSCAASHPATKRLCACA